jgi:glycogen synthase
LACGTPVIARRVGGLPEIIREGVDGWFGDDVRHLAFLVERTAALDRAEIRRGVLDRFSAERMTDDYEAEYESLLDELRSPPQRSAQREGSAPCNGRATRRTALGAQKERSPQ